MMFGTREEFEYFLCAACGCLQITQFPLDMSPHYPDRYYSFSGLVAAKPVALWRRILRRLKLHVYLNRGWVGRRLSRHARVSEELQTWGRSAGIEPGSRILEIGCGSGHLLSRMAEWGFTNLTGVDPYVSSDLSLPGGVRIHRRDLAEMRGTYDFIMLHHAFEHMPDPLEALGQMRRLLSPGGSILIRIPLCSSLAWEKYGTNWVQLDAPRHFFLHSFRSLEILARDAGLMIRDIIHDSTAFQFWGSEQYLRDLPLFDPRSHAVNPGTSLFTTAEIARFRQLAHEANQSKTGDQACFILTTVS